MCNQEGRLTLSEIQGHTSTNDQIDIPGKFNCYCESKIFMQNLRSREKEKIMEEMSSARRYVRPTTSSVVVVNSEEVFRKARYDEKRLQ